MKSRTVFLFSALLMTAMCMGAVGDVTAQSNFPERKIELVVPWSAGGGTDRTARLLADVAQKELGVPVFVTNRTGGAGVVGHHFVTQAKPDGYTLCMMTVEICTVSHLGIAKVYPTGFDPVVLCNFDAAAITVRADAPYETIQDFIADAKRKKGQGGLRVGNSGPGAIWHLAAAGFAQATDIELRYVPYDGAAPAIRALLGGEIEAVSVSGAEVLTNVEAGLLKTLCVFNDERLDILPDVPALSEMGIDFKLGAWRGIAAPKGVPPEVMKKLEAAFTKAYESERFQEIMKNNGLGMLYLNHEQFDKFLPEQYEKFRGIIRNLGLIAE
jgi:tripartite-type tricarboxylate transporter receptor subunit TctC